MDDMYLCPIREDICLGLTPAGNPATAANHLYIDNILGSDNSFNSVFSWWMQVELWLEVN